MPIEIRELQIRVNVNERSTQRAESSDRTTQTRERESGDDALVSECIEQVLKIIEGKKER